MILTVLLEGALTMEPALPCPLCRSDIAQLKNIIMHTGVDFLFYGIQAGLFVAALSLLARRSSRMHILAMTIIILFLLSTISVTLGVLFYVMQFPTGYGGTIADLTDFLDRLIVVLAVAARLNYLISDGVVVWRAWTIWIDNRYAKVVLLACMCGSTIGSAVECTWSLQSTRRGQEESATRTLMLTVPLLVTNIVSTAFVAIRVWLYRRDIKASLSPYIRPTSVEKVLLLLLESGCFYCLIWVVNLLVRMTQGVDTLGVYGVVSVAYHAIPGIHSTFMILAVAMQRRSPMQSILDSMPLHSLDFACSREDQDLTGAGASLTDHGHPSI
ncbi:uncharacterized protein SCHCODRAFT_02631094 [Schizophyllum commune H4-8]|uniref:Expressed protein n=1 Tax=Schizophyllum commune (strain H4-8 / FGSC 9210) TaxID=578458 RepID=D8QA16_SCHCM|nr:uncharacterized protein SCHCODRAFT_02631094 [Schizophyllum commune H4-8]KAI5890190.1 hypothetical protein SCHCODRAFT_02631094 [Schizophyllum commune H4-8]